MIKFIKFGTVQGYTNLITENRTLNTQITVSIMISLIKFIVITCLLKLNMIDGLYDYIKNDKFNLRHQLSSDDISDLCYAVPLTKAAQNKGALCIDGSVPRYYWRNGTQTKKFQIYFQGKLIFYIYIIQNIDRINI